MRSGGLRGARLRLEHREDISADMIPEPFRGISAEADKRGWRKLVPSPQPQDIIETDVISTPSTVA
jgi:carbamate kinase